MRYHSRLIGGQVLGVTLLGGQGNAPNTGVAALPSDSRLPLHSWIHRIGPCGIDNASRRMDTKKSEGDGCPSPSRDRKGTCRLLAGQLEIDGDVAKRRITTRGGNRTDQSQVRKATLVVVDARGLRSSHGSRGQVREAWGIARSALVRGAGR